MVGCERKSPRMLRLTAKYADLWNTGYMGPPEMMEEAIPKIQDACKEVGRDPASIGVTALIGLWFPDLWPPKYQGKKPSFLENPLTGTTQEIAKAFQAYAKLGIQHIMIQCEPYNPEAVHRLTESVKLYHTLNV